MSKRPSESTLLCDVDEIEGLDHVAPAVTAQPRAIVGTLVSLVDTGAAYVIYPGQPGQAAIEARLAVDVGPRQIGSAVLLQFEDGDPMRPIVLAWIRTPRPWSEGAVPAQVEVEADGRKLTVHAKEGISLRCGQASITLTRAGKVLIEGTYVSSRSTGVNRIKGGSIQLN